MENPIKMDDLGGTPIFGNTQMTIYVLKGILSTYSTTATPSAATIFVA